MKLEKQINKLKDMYFEQFTVLEAEFGTDAVNYEIKVENDNKIMMYVNSRDLNNRYEFAMDVNGLVWKKTYDLHTDKLTYYEDKSNSYECEYDYELGKEYKTYHNYTKSFDLIGTDIFDSRWEYIYKQTFVDNKMIFWANEANEDKVWSYKLECGAEVIQYKDKLKMPIIVCGEVQYYVYKEVFIEPKDIFWVMKQLEENGMEWVYLV